MDVELYLFLPGNVCYGETRVCMMRGTHNFSTATVLYSAIQILDGVEFICMPMFNLFCMGAVRKPHIHFLPHTHTHTHIPNLGPVVRMCINTSNQICLSLSRWLCVYFGSHRYGRQWRQMRRRQ